MNGYLLGMSDSDFIWSDAADCVKETLADYYGEDTIVGCTRAMALEEGILIDVTDTAKEANFTVPVALTQAAYELTVELSDAARLAGNDEEGRLWDVLWMFRLALLGDRDASELFFQVLVVTTSIEPTLLVLKGVCGPGDAGEPVLTVMLPNES